MAKKIPIASAMTTTANGKLSSASPPSARGISEKTFFTGLLRRRCHSTHRLSAAPHLQSLLPWC